MDAFLSADGDAQAAVNGKRKVPKASAPPPQDGSTVDQDATLADHAPAAEANGPEGKKKTNKKAKQASEAEIPLPLEESAQAEFVPSFEKEEAILKDIEKEVDKVLEGIEKISNLRYPLYRQDKEKAKELISKQEAIARLPVLLESASELARQSKVLTPEKKAEHLNRFKTLDNELAKIAEEAKSNKSAPLYSSFNDAVDMVSLAKLLSDADTRNFLGPVAAANFATIKKIVYEPFLEAIKQECKAVATQVENYKLKFSELETLHRNHAEELAIRANDANKLARSQAAEIVDLKKQVADVTAAMQKDAKKIEDLTAKFADSKKQVAEAAALADEANSKHIASEKEIEKLKKEVVVLKKAASAAPPPPSVSSAPSGKKEKDATSQPPSASKATTPPSAKSTAPIPTATMPIPPQASAGNAKPAVASTKTAGPLAPKAKNLPPPAPKQPTSSPQPLTMQEVVSSAESLDPFVVETNQAPPADTSSVGDPFVRAVKESSEEAPPPVDDSSIFDLE